MDRPEGTPVHGMTMDTDHHYTAGSRAAVFVAVLDHFPQPPLVFLKPLTTCVSGKATQSAKGTLFTFKVIPKVSDDALVVVFSKQAYHASENGHCDLRWRKLVVTSRSPSLSTATLVNFDLRGAMPSQGFITPYNRTENSHLYDAFPAVAHRYSLNKRGLAVYPTRANCLVILDPAAFRSQADLFALNGGVPARPVQAVLPIRHWRLSNDGMTILRTVLSTRAPDVPEQKFAVAQPTNVPSAHAAPTPGPPSYSKGRALVPCAQSVRPDTHLAHQSVQSSVKPTKPQASHRAPLPPTLTKDVQFARAAVQVPQSHLTGRHPLGAAAQGNIGPERSYPSQVAKVTGVTQEPSVRNTHQGNVILPTSATVCVNPYMEHLSEDASASEDDSEDDQAVATSSRSRKDPSAPTANLRALPMPRRFDAPQQSSAIGSMPRGKATNVPSGMQGERMARPQRMKFVPTPTNQEPTCRTPWGEPVQQGADSLPTSSSSASSSQASTSTPATSSFSAYEQADSDFGSVSNASKFISPWKVKTKSEEDALKQLLQEFDPNAIIVHTQADSQAFIHDFAERFQFQPPSEARPVFKPVYLSSSESFYKSMQASSLTSLRPAYHVFKTPTADYIAPCVFVPSKRTFAEAMHPGPASAGVPDVPEPALSDVITTPKQPRCWRYEHVGQCFPIFLIDPDTRPRRLPGAGPLTSTRPRTKRSRASASPVGDPDESEEEYVPVPTRSRRRPQPQPSASNQGLDVEPLSAVPASTC